MTAGRNRRGTWCRGDRRKNSLSTWMRCTAPRTAVSLPVLQHVLTRSISRRRRTWRRCRGTTASSIRQHVADDGLGDEHPPDRAARSTSSTGWPSRSWQWSGCRWSRCVRPPSWTASSRDLPSDGTRTGRPDAALRRGKDVANRRYDVARCVTEAVLTNPEPHLGKVYKLTGPLRGDSSRGRRRFHKSLGGRPITYKNIPLELWLERAWRFFAHPHTVVGTWSRWHCCTGTADTTDPRGDVNLLTGVLPMSIVDFAGASERLSQGEVPASRIFRL